MVGDNPVRDILIAICIGIEASADASIRARIMSMS